jgi:ABC-type dipeptide/oligopeptide/nickel transport system permease component
VLVFILRRLLLMIPTTLGVAAVVFTIFQAAPGDAATVMLGASGGGEMGGKSDFESRKRAFEIEHGLDRNPVIQYLDYIGPFNLSRDGHAWFDSPYSEREVERVELDGGGEAVYGKPLRIPFPPAVPEELRPVLESHALTLTKADATESERTAAAEALVDAGTDAWPAVLSAFQRQEVRLDDLETLRRLDDVASRLVARSGGDDVGFASLLDGDEPRANDVLRSWFGWYYTRGGGDRVQNSGENPWGGLLLLDLGNEIQSGLDIKEELWARLKRTVPLSIIAVLISYLIALPLGIFSARKQGTLIDSLITVVLFVLYSIPTFWAGLMLILAFGVTGPDWYLWPELPVLGLHDADADKLGPLAYAWDYVLHIILPVATLSYGGFAYISRLMRSGMLDVIRQDYIRTARAKGLSEKVVIYKHTLRNSLIPVITLFASVLPILIGGAVIVEMIFNIQGMGKYAYDGLLRRDFNIIMATTIFVGVMTQFGILISDVVYSLVDPRIRHD